MKQVFKLAPLAVAVAALSVSGAVVANSDGDGERRGHHRDGAHLSKHVHVSKKVAYEGDVEVDGRIRVNALGMAVVDQEQDSDDNAVGNDRVDNNAILGGNALRNGKGNIGVNSVAGDNNVQSNAAALAAADAGFVFGSADAEIFVDQNADGNFTLNHGTINNAIFAGDALENARGNIGVNSAAGNSNVQANSFAAAVASGSMGEATVSVAQETENNETLNLPEETFEVITTQFSVGGTLSGTYQGNGSGSYAGTNGPARYVGTNGPARYSGTNFGATYSGANGPATYSGTSSQSNDVYPEIWQDDGVHANGDNAQIFGHIDFDNQGVLPGRFEFDESGTISASRESGRIGRSAERGTVGSSRESGTVGSSRESGSLGFSEAGTQSLSGTLTGSAQHVISRYVRHQNNAIMGDDALNNARGNIGVNIAAGTGNLQNNSLAMTKVDALDVAPGGEGGGGTGGE